jgi:prepilin-type N-terminal cleavage/methylation domain-containing protein
VPETFESEDGFSLIELLVAMVILGVGVVSVMATIGTAIIGSSAHRNHASAETVTRDFSEAVVAKANTEGTYQICPSATDLTPSFTGPTNSSGTALYLVTIEAPPAAQWGSDFVGSSPQPVEYWIPGGALPDGSATAFPNGAYRPRGTSTASTTSKNDCWAFVRSVCPTDLYGGSSSYKPPASCDPGIQRVWIHVRTNPAVAGAKLVDSVDQYSRIVVRRYDAQSPT